LIAQDTVHEGGQLIAGTPYFVRIRAIVSTASSQVYHPETGMSGKAYDTNGDGTNDYTDPRATLVHWNKNGMGEPKLASTKSEIPRCPPLKPVNVGGYAIRGHPDNYHVVWTHPITNNGAAITQWKIEYSDQADTDYAGTAGGHTNDVTTHEFVANNDEHHGMTHYRPGTDYYWNIPSMPVGRFINLRVYAKNDQGYGLPMAVEARCEPDVEDCTAENRARGLPGLPGAVTVSAPSNDNEFTKSSLLVSWNAGVTGGITNSKYKVEWDTVPSFDTRQGRPLSYEFATLGTSPEVLESSAYLGRLQYNITELAQGVNIFVRITSHNSLGYSMSGCLSSELGKITCKPSVVTPSAVLAAKPMEPPGLTHPIGPTNVKLALLGVEENHREKGTCLDVAMYPPVSNGGDDIQRYRVEWTTDPDFGTEEIRTLHSTRVSGTAVSGYFRLEYDTTNCTTCQVRNLQQTERLPHNVHEWDLRTALQNMENVAGTTVTKTVLDAGQETYTWSITFHGDVGPLPAFRIIDTEMVDGTVTETIVTPGTTPTDYCGSYGGVTKCPEVTENLDASPVTHRITGLVPGTEYRVRVSAYNALGYGPTRVTTPPVATPPKQPPSAPTNPFHFGPGTPILKVTSPASLTVRYGPPDFDGGDTILKYKIEWDTATTFDSAPGNTKLPIGSAVVLGGMKNEYIITGLNTGTRYFVRTFAYNTAGRYGDVALTSPTSEVPRSSPDVPTLVSLEVASSTSIRSSFSPALSNGNPIAKYNVHAYTRSPVYPHFGVEEVQTIRMTSDNALGNDTFTLSFGDINKPLPGNVSVQQNLAQLGTTMDLTEHIARGDPVRVGTYTYNVHENGIDRLETADYIFSVSDTDTFNEKTLSLHKPYPGATSQDNHGDSSLLPQQHTSMVAYQRETTMNLHWNASAADVKNALEMLPSFGTCEVTKEFETPSASPSLPTWHVTFTHGNSGPPEFAMVGVGDQPMLVPNFNLLGAWNTYVNVTETVTGTLPQDYKMTAVDANVGSPYTQVLDGLRLSQTYFVSVSAVNERGEGLRQVAITPAPYIAPQRLAGPAGATTTLLKVHSGTSLLVEFDENADAGGYIQGCIQVETTGHCKGDQNVIDHYRVEYATDASFVGSQFVENPVDWTIQKNYNKRLQSTSFRNLFIELWSVFR
jgi:hypothetical protein